MSSSSMSSEGVSNPSNVAGTVPQSPRPPVDQAGSRPEAPVATSDNAVEVSQSITSVAETVRKDKASSLESIANVADNIKEAIDTLNSALARSRTTAIISHDDQLNRYIVKIADENSGEIIREVPSEAVLKFARNLQEIKGLLFDKSL